MAKRSVAPQYIAAAANTNQDGCVDSSGASQDCIFDKKSVPTVMAEHKESITPREPSKSRNVVK